MSKTEAQSSWIWSSIERKCFFFLQRRGNSRVHLLSIHAFILRHALETNLNLITKLVTSLSSVEIDSHRGTIHARQLFDRLTHKSDSFLCNTMMKSHLHSRQFLEAISLYAGLRRNGGFVPDNFTFSTLAKCCGLNHSIWEGKEVHAHVVKYGFKSNLYVATALVDMYGKLGQIGFARELFDEMTVRSPVSWTALINGYVRCGDMASAKGLFMVMPEYEKDSATFNVMIDGYVKLGEMESAKMLFDVMPEKNVVSWTTMIDGYCTNGEVDEARLLFDQMPDRNLYTWNALIGGYCQNKQPKEALVLFQELLAGNMFEPDDVTVVSVLPAIADLGALDVGNWVYGYVKRKKLDRSANVSTALVDMYAKCGEIEKARRVFDDVQGRATCTWNALINGLALNGCANKALAVFLEMMKKRFKPNEITMLAVLSACNHGGLVDEGKKWFNKMDEFGLTPRIEHYGCLVDLLGRAGCLDEAENLIEKMPYEANGIILSSFLFACGYAKDVNRAERVVKKAINMEPFNDGNYIMLRNLYASERRWGDVEQIKKLMLKKGAKKEAGYSAIEINSQVLEFVAGDKVHPYLNMIRFVLDQLQMHMKGQNPYNSVDCEMGMFMSLMGKGLPTAQMLGLVMGTLHRQFIEKDIKSFEQFHMAILDIFSTVNAALPGKHYDVPSIKEVEVCFNEWKVVDEIEKKRVFIEFMKKKVSLSKLDDSTLLAGIATPPAAMAAKRAGESVPQLKLIKAIPDVIFVPAATIFALISIKISRKMFLGNVAS